MRAKAAEENAVLWNLGFKIPGRINNCFVVFTDLSAWMKMERSYTLCLSSLPAVRRLSQGRNNTQMDEEKAWVKIWTCPFDNYIRRTMFLIIL